MSTAAAETAAVGSAELRVTTHEMGAGSGRYSLGMFGPACYIKGSAETVALIVRALNESNISRAEWIAAVE